MNHKPNKPAKPVNPHKSKPVQVESSFTIQPGKNKVYLNTFYGPAVAFAANHNGRTYWYCSAEVRGVLHMKRVESMFSAMLTLVNWRGVHSDKLTGEIYRLCRRHVR